MYNDSYTRQKKRVQTKIFLDDFHSLETESLRIDYLRFNLDFLGNSEIHKLATYFKRLGFSSYTKQRHLIFTDKKHELTFIIATPFQKGTHLEFAGESARKLYSVIKERRFDWTHFEHYGAFLRRIDICHDRVNKPTDKISNPQFIESTLAQFKVSLPNNSLKFEQNKMGQITAVGHRNSARYYRVYSKRKGESLRFEFEHKHRKTLNLYYSLLK